MTTDCLRLDDYLDGRLTEPDAEAFETHTLTCTDCDAALDAANGLDLSPLREVACPPAVLDAALHAARRAPDRAPVASARRYRFRLPLVALALAAVAVLAFGLARVLASGAPAPVVAEQILTPPIAPPGEALTPEPEAPPLADTPEPAEAPELVAPSPPLPEPTAPRRAPAAPSPVPAVAPAPEPADAPQDAIAQRDAQPEEDLSPEAVEAAQRDIALAFSLVAEAQTRAGDAIRTRAGSVSETIDQTLPF
ncbi:hypothetical protein B1759_00190 [Rubrivirga sp. SAORIC476]|uniref:zf-HC2 domain-containing protein n=1 Tax=Rubrivirga sp. SAORIC476 TaxID=1961794 RepID=UPI000BA9A4E7|nr:zf-HC2 domain-containing protein [Rubrivirga sp. SAORIC476]PAP82212.1 hypothetical protein B1759_00190 [Rubrivirga sp. SAORIC476]